MGYGTKSAYFHPINLYLYKYQLKAKIYCQTFGLFFWNIYLVWKKKTTKQPKKANGHHTHHDLHPTAVSPALTTNTNNARVVPPATVTLLDGWDT
mgnify:CR=1 FL=1